MKNLLDITKILTQKKIGKIEILDEQTLRQKDSLFGKFYKGLCAEKIETDEEAAQLLYGTPDIGDTYRKLKSRFRRRLLNTLFFVDMNVPLASNYDQALLTCSKEWTIVEILMAYEAKQAAATITKRTLGIALKFHLTDLIVKCARLLCEYAVYEEKEKDFRYYNAYIIQYVPIQELELKAETFGNEAILLYQQPDCGKKCIQKIETISHSLVGLLEKVYAPPIVHYYMYLAWTLYYEVSQDYDGMLDVCQNGEIFVKEKASFLESRKRPVFFIKRLAVYLHQRQYNNGKTHAEEILQHLQIDSIGWFDFMKYYLLLSLHTDNFINALAIFSRVAASTHFHKLDAHRQQEWGLFEVVLHYFMEVQGTSRLLLPKQRRKVFSVSDFMSSPIDLHASFANIVVQRITLQILFLLQKRSHQSISERMEQLRNLTKYELQKKGYERPYAFVNLLLQLQKADLNPKKLNNPEKNLQKLKLYPFIYQGKLMQLEALPYEKLWELVCAHLA